MDDKLTEILKNVSPETKQFILDLLAISYGVEYGVFNLKLNIHRKSIKKAEFKGWKTITYGKSEQDQQKAVKDLAEKIAIAKKNKQNCKLHFLVDLKAGFITGIYWDSFYEKIYSP